MYSFGLRKMKSNFYLCSYTPETFDFIQNKLIIWVYIDKWLTTLYPWVNSKEAASKYLRTDSVIIDLDNVHEDEHVGRRGRMQK